MLEVRIEQMLTCERGVNGRKGRGVTCNMMGLKKLNFFDSLLFCFFRFLGTDMNVVNYFSKFIKPSIVPLLICRPTL